MPDRWGHIVQEQLSGERYCSIGGKNLSIINSHILYRWLVKSFTCNLPNLRQFDAKLRQFYAKIGGDLCPMEMYLFGIHRIQDGKG